MRSKIARAVAAKAITSFLLLAAGVGVRAQSRVIDQLWQFSPDPGAKFTAATVDRQAKWRPDRAGLSWNAQFEDLRDYAGVGWYRVTITLPQPLPSTRELIHFGAVDYFTEVWVNGIRLGEHEGGYTPFTFDLTGKVHAGNNEILLKVFDPPMPPAVPTRRTQNSEPPTEVLKPGAKKPTVEPKIQLRRNSPWQAELVCADQRPLAARYFGNGTDALRCVGARHAAQQR